MNGWSVVYEKAIRDDGSLWFPERLTMDFLNKQKRTQGSYMFANQYQNEVIPRDEMVFKPEWKKYYKFIPENVNTFAFIDPAISLEEGADYTGLVVIKVDTENNWYVSQAKRFRLSPTDIVELIFKVKKEFTPRTIGIESVSFQAALIHMVSHEMKRRNDFVNISEIRPETDKTKEMRIQSLVPRFEWGNIFLSQGLTDLEEELDKFPRSRHDDLLDALAYMDKIAFKPQVPRRDNVNKHPGSPDYERNFIRGLKGRRQQSDSED